MPPPATPSILDDFITLYDALQPNKELPSFRRVDVDVSTSYSGGCLPGVPRYAVAGKVAYFTKDLDKLLKNAKAKSELEAIRVPDYTHHSADNEAGVTAVMWDLVLNNACKTLEVYINVMMKDSPLLDELGDDFQVISQSHHNEGGSSVFLDLEIVRMRHGSRLKQKRTQLVVEYKPCATLEHGSWQTRRTCVPKSGGALPKREYSKIQSKTALGFHQTLRYAIDSDCEWLLIIDGKTGKAIRWWRLNAAERTVGLSCQQTELNTDSLRYGVAGLFIHTYLRKPVADEEQLSKEPDLPDLAPPVLPLALREPPPHIPAPPPTHGLSTRAATAYGTAGSITASAAASATNSAANSAANNPANNTGHKLPHHPINRGRPIGSVANSVPSTPRDGSKNNNRPRRDPNQRDDSQGPGKHNS